MIRSFRTGIHHGDTRELITRIPSGPVNLIVALPPYPGRPGGVHPDEFVPWFLPFADEFWRVIHRSSEHPGTLHQRRTPYMCAKSDRGHALQTLALG
jgi:hypothetical protein